MTIQWKRKSTEREERRDKEKGMEERGGENSERGKRTRRRAERDGRACFTLKALQCISLHHQSGWNCNMQVCTEDSFQKLSPNCSQAKVSLNSCGQKGLGEEKEPVCGLAGPNGQEGGRALNLSCHSLQAST